MTKLKDLTLSTCTDFTSEETNSEFLLTMATVTEHDMDSYGLNKVILYSDTNLNLAGWKVQFYSIEQSAWVYCSKDATEAPTDATITNVTIACVPNARTKKVKLVPPSGKGKLCEVVVVGDASHKYACDTGWSSDTGNQSCDPCPSGRWGTTNDEGRNICNICSGGTYSKYVAFDPLLTCLDCPVGTFSADNAAACTPCAFGTFAGVTKSSKCTDCIAGKHQDAEGQSECKECFAGTYADVPGLTDCIDCKVGTYSNESKSQSCTKCGEGYFQDLVKKTSCTKCEAGGYADKIGSENCTPCAAGTFSEKDGAKKCQQCPTGKYQNMPGKTACIECKVGTFAEADGAASCTACPKGQFADAAGSSSCKVCPKGKFMAQVGSTTCTLCPKNSYQDTEGQAECKQCETGSSSASGSATCFSCLKGTFLNSDTMECINCAAGTYADTEGASSCTVTGINQYQDEEKAETFKKCDAGTIAASKGATKCDSCDRGLYRPSTSDEPVCAACSPGTFAENKGSASCENCPVGTYSEMGAIECKLCVAGQYQDVVGQTICKKCAPGTFSENPGSSTCTACIADTYSNEQGSFTCISCTYGYYQPSPGSTNCITCPKRAAYQPASCPPVIPKCPSLSYTNQYGDFSWPEKDPPDNSGDAEDVFKECGFALYGEDGPLEKGKVSRKCITWKEGDQQKSNWTDASYSTCGTYESKQIYDVQQQLKTAMEEAKESGTEVELSPEVSQDILTSLTKATKGKEIGAADSANVVAALSAVSGTVDLTNKENQDNMLDAINSFADQDPAFISDSGGDTTAQAVNVIENIGAGILAASNGSGAEPVKTKTMTIASTPVNEKSKTEVTALSFGNDEEDEEEEVEPTEPAKEATEEAVEEIVQAENDAFVLATEDPLEKAQKIAEEKAKSKVIKQPKKIVNIAMPPLGDLLDTFEDGKKPAGLICVVFNSANLFPTNKTKDASPEQTAVEEVVETIASNVVLLSLGDKPVYGIDPPLKLNFSKEEPTDVDLTTKTVNYKCVYYKPKTKEWSSEGCTTLAANKSFGGEVQCSCDHMTSFAILMSVEPIPDNLAKIQSLITNPLIALSLISLCLMVGMIMPIKQLRSTRSMKIHLSLAGSQAFAIAVFLCTNFITPSSPAPLCAILAVMLHYAYLVVFMWTIVESVIMYISLVQVFGGHISKYMLKFNIFCWSVPILSPITSYFLTDTDLLMDNKCVVKPSISQYSFILPIGVVLLINTYIFFALLKVIVKAKSPDKSATANAMKQLKAVASISCLLGLGWMVAFFGFGVLAPYCQFAFIILNGGQGVMMFIFYCLLNDQFIDEWRNKFGLPPRIPQNKTTSSSAAAGQTRATVVQAAPAPAVMQAAPKPTPAAAAPKPTPAANRDPKPNDSWVKNEPEDVVYENNTADNIYDTLDDPDIGSMNPATITRI